MPLRDDGIALDAIRRINPNKKTGSWLKSLGLQLPDNLTSSLTGNYRSVSKDVRIPVQDSIADMQPKSKIQRASYSLSSESAHARAAAAKLSEKHGADAPEHSADEKGLR